MTDPVVAPKTPPKAITIKHLAYELAEQHRLRYSGPNIQSISNNQAIVLMEDLVELITAHLKKGERVKLSVRRTVPGFAEGVVKSLGSYREHSP